MQNSPLKKRKDNKKGTTQIPTDSLKFSSLDRLFVLVARQMEPPRQFRFEWFWNRHLTWLHWNSKNSIKRGPNVAVWPSIDCIPAFEELPEFLNRFYNFSSHFSWSISNIVSCRRKRHEQGRVTECENITRACDSTDFSQQVCEQLMCNRNTKSRWRLQKKY